MSVVPVPRATRFSIAWPSAMLCCGALALCFAIVALSRFPFDDAFIHMRIARNLAFYGQPYFNLGERVMGDSSLLWLLIVSGLFRLANQPAPALVVGLECALTAALLYSVDRYLTLTSGKRSWLTTGISFVLVVLLVLLSAGFLMESSLALLLIVLSQIAALRQRPVWTGLALGLAVATRYEMCLLAGLAWLATPGVRGRGLFLAGFAPPILVQCTLLEVWYGALVPNTVHAKSIVYPLHWSQFLGGVPAFAHLGALFAACWVAGAFACAVLAWQELRRSGDDLALRSTVVLGAFGGLLLVAYAAKHTNMFGWYWPNLTMPAALAAATTLLRLVDRRPGSPAESRLSLAAVGLIAVATFPYVGKTANMVLNAALNRPDRSGSLFSSLRTDTYQAVGGELFRACPKSVMITSEIGAIGWAYKSKIIDGVGLVSPEVLRYHPMRVPEQRESEGIGSVPAQAVADLAPDLVVGMELFLHDFLVQHDKQPKLAQYQLVEQRPVIVDQGVASPLWGSQFVLVYARPGGCLGTLLNR